MRQKLRPLVHLPKCFEAIHTLNNIYFVRLNRHSPAVLPQCFIVESSLYWFHIICRTTSFPMRDANSRTRHTSWKLLASPRLIRTTPSSRPIWHSKSFRVTPGYSLLMSSSMPKSAAAPPGLQTHPVRREIRCFVAACSMNEFGRRSPSGWEPKKNIH